MFVACVSLCAVCVVFVVCVIYWVLNDIDELCMKLLSLILLMFKSHRSVLCDIIGKPKAEVITEPDKEGSSRPISSDREFSITTVSGRSSNITSRGERRRDGQKTEISDAATLTASRESDDLHCIEQVTLKIMMTL